MSYKKLFIFLFCLFLLQNKYLYAVNDDKINDNNQQNEIDNELIGNKKKSVKESTGDINIVNIETSDGIDTVIVKNTTKQNNKTNNLNNQYNDEFYNNFKVIDTKSQKINKKVNFEIKVSDPKNTQNGSAVLNLQEAYNCYKNKDYELAVHFYKQSLLDNPESVEGRFGLGVSYQMLHQYDQAIASYLQLFSKNYSRKKIVNNLLMCLQHKSYKEALDILLSINNKIDGYSDILSQIGLIYMKTGDNARAISALNKAYELAPMNAIIAYNLAILYDNENNIDYAKHFFDLAIKNDIADYLNSDELKQLEKKVEQINKKILDEINNIKNKK